MRSLTIACALALVGACSDSAPVLLDAAPLPDADRLTQCLIPADYGALGARTGTQDSTGTGTPSITVVLDPGPPKDDFFLKLVSGKGAFTGGLAIGTFVIGGADASFAGCGVCTNLLAEHRPRHRPGQVLLHRLRDGDDQQHEPGGRLGAEPPLRRDRPRHRHGDPGRLHRHPGVDHVRIVTATSPPRGGT